MALPLSTQPRDLLLDANNDLVFTNGDLSFTTGTAAVAQSCRIALQMFAGEWFLDLDAGIPYWQSILGQRSDVAIKAAQIAFREALEGVVGVAKVNSLVVAFDGSTRAMTVTFNVTTGFGDTAADTIALAVSGAVVP